VVYDLDPTLTVVTARGELSLEEAAGSRCRMLEVVGEGTNTSRGLVSMTDRGPIVWDSESYITHATIEARPEDVGEKAVAGAAQLAARLKSAGLLTPRVVKAAEARLEREAEPEETWGRMHALVDELVKQYVYFGEGTENERWVNLSTGQSYSEKALRGLLAPLEMTLDAETPTGRPTTKRVNPIDLLVRHRDRIVMVGYQFTPGNPARLIEADSRDGYMLNLWEPPWFGDVEPYEDVTWFLEFLAYLVPDEEECAYLLNWIARKVQHPEERGVAMLLVTPKMGTGRNVLMKIVKSLLGTKFCGDVSQSVLTGTSGQSQYDDALINKVLITCDEIVAGHASYDLKQKAYERLKSVCDPYVQWRSFNRKGLSLIEGHAHYSALLASNHEYDALPLPPGDRRFAVIACTREPFKTHRPDIKAHIDRALPMGAKMANMSMIAGLHAWLSELDTSVEDFLTVKDTLVRRAMIEDGEGEIERTIRVFLAKMPPDQPCFRFDDLARRGKDWLMSDHPVAARAFEKLARKKMREGFAGWTMALDRVRVGDGGTDAAVERGIVERDGVELTPAERGRWLGTKE